MSGHPAPLARGKLAVCIIVSTAIIGMLAAGATSANEVVDSGSISDIVLEANDGGFYLIFYDARRDARVTSGTVIFYKKMIRLKDAPKMEGRGINQQIVMERVEYEEYEPMAEKVFGESDFRRVKIEVGEPAMALPVKLPGVKQGDRIRMEFGDIRKDVVIGY